MWIFTRYGFYSVTRPSKEQNANGDQLQVRARNRAHLSRLQHEFPEQLGSLEIHDWPTRDYRYRFFVDRSVWASINAELVAQVDYSNFKGVCDVQPDHAASGYAASLHHVWIVMHGLQSPKGSAAAPPAHSAAVDAKEGADNSTAITSALERELRSEIAEATDPPLGEWKDARHKRPIDPARLFLMPSKRDWGGSEHSGYLRACAAELNIESVLELGTDIALYQMVEQRLHFDQFVKARAALLSVRRFAQRLDPPATMLTAAQILLKLPSGAEAERVAHTEQSNALYMAYRSAGRAILNGAIVASRLLNDGDSWRELDEKIGVDHIGDSELDADGAVVSLIRRRLGHMGRRTWEARVRKAADQRVLWTALNLKYRERSGIWGAPRQLSAGSKWAVEFSKSKNLTLAVPIDGAGAFRYAIGAHFASKSGDERVIKGYAFQPDGDPVYIVRMREPGELTTKRCWKAHEEYTEWIQPSTLGPVEPATRPKGSLYWPTFQ